MNRRIISLAFVAGISGSIWASAFSGVVIDKQTREPLIGSALRVKELPRVGTTAGLDGSFTLKGLPEKVKSITILCSYTGYAPREITVSVDNLKKLTIELEAKERILASASVKGKRQLNTERSARQLEMKSMQVMNIMSAQAIKLSPDINVAGVMQRMSGVVMEKGNTGEGQYAVLRGMDKRYNYSTVNGIKIPSPENKDRYVPLDLFPSELLDRLEVRKSLTPDMEGDATGGAINMVMKDAPEQLSVQAHASTGYNSMLFGNDFASFGSSITETSPREAHGSSYTATTSDFSKATSNISYKKALPDLNGGLSIGKRFFDKRFGIILAGSLQNSNRITKGILYADEMSQVESTVHVTQQKKRTYNESVSQYGAHMKMDYKINDGSKLEWYNSYIGSTADQVRESNTTYLTLNYSPKDGNLLQDIETRSRHTVQGILSSTLKGTHAITPHLIIDWTGVFAKATNKRPDNTTITLENSTENYSSLITADAAERRWEHNSDRDWAAHLNASYKRAFGQIKAEIKAGGMYRTKDRENRYVSYAFSPSATSRPVQGVDFNSLSEIEWKLSTPYGSINALNYDAGEDIGAAYVMGKAESKRGHQIIFGLRAEHTLQSYSMLYPTTSDSPNGEQEYWDFLPSVHFKYAINKKMSTRAS